MTRREEEALALREGGSSYEQISREMGVSVSTAWRLISNALQKYREVSKQAASGLRDLEAKRLDSAQSAIWPRVLDGDPRAVDSFLRLSQRRSALLGLDARPLNRVEHGEWSTYVLLRAEISKHADMKRLYDTMTYRMNEMTHDDKMKLVAFSHLVLENIESAFGGEDCIDIETLPTPQNH